MSLGEWVLLDEQGVVSIVTSSKQHAELQSEYPQFRVVPIGQVPLPVLEKYEFWTKRP